MSSKTFNFQKLNPTKDVELNTYEEALNFTFDDNEIKNVAISGPYSAGKSSLIESYKKKYSEKSFLHISLAHFGTEDSPKENVLEVKILNQLIHQIEPSKIPLTNFKVKKKASYRDTLETTIVLFIGIISLLYILFLDKWSNFVSTLNSGFVKSILSWTTNADYKLFAGILLVLIVGYATFTIIRIQRERNIFKKLSLNGNEIELFFETEESFFDKYLNEVLYLFEESEADVIVFEDLDRYNVNQIFEKLREINTLINNKKILEKKSPIRFFYLLRDDIFESKERTKFFDFIIPVVPVIDSSNSYDQFIEHFREGGIQHLFNQDFLQKLSLYIDDMRILKNIYNEFRIYYERLLHVEVNNDKQSNENHPIEINENKLLAIITYKNIFPKDFSDLQLGKGYVNCLFENKAEIIDNEISSTKKLIDEKEKMLYLAEKEFLESENELDALYLIPNTRITAVNGKTPSDLITRDKLIQEMKDYPDNVQYHNGRYYPILNLKSELEELNKNDEYAKRKNIINHKHEDRRNHLNNELTNLKKRKMSLENSLLKNLVNQKNVDEVFNLDFIKDNKNSNTYKSIIENPYFRLIKYLVRNGFLDETYSDYMTYFYANSLSRTDKNFLLSITDQVAKEFAYKLTSPNKILSRLNLLDFDQCETLNFDLLTYLLNTQTTNTNYLNRLLQQLIDTNNLNFVIEYLEQSEEDTSKFVQIISQKWPELFLSLYKDGRYTDDQIKDLAIRILYYSTKETIKNQNKYNGLSDFISNSHDFLNIEEPMVEQLIHGFKYIGVKFDSIDYYSSNKELYREVYLNSLYQLNFDNVSLLLDTFYELDSVSSLNSKNLSLIRSDSNQSLVEYVDENINQYIEEIVLRNCNEQINDDESTILYVLNHPKMDRKNVLQYISYLESTISNISDVNEMDLWSVLLQERVIVYSSSNIMEYFKKFTNTLDNYLVDFINSSTFSLIFIQKNHDKSDIGDFFDAVVKCNELENGRYAHILTALNWRYVDTFPFKEIDDDKVQILIRKGTIPMSEAALEFMRENYPSAINSYIIYNIEKYAKEVINAENYNYNELIMVLNSKVDYRTKLNLLEYAKEDITIVKKNYPETIKLHILQNNLDKADIPYLLKHFPNVSINIGEEIVKISIKYIGELVEEEWDIDFELLAKLFNSNEIPEETKKDLLTVQLNRMNDIEAKEFLTLLKMDDFRGLFDRRRPKFEINKRNERILSIFLNKKWISKFDDKNGEYQAYGRKV
ncbi:hypothetical protein ACIQLG_16930 [Terribacillus saccharophilus]|uniref:YobI family P-loop NTPase n=1 Tax=Terribacillus saccharophilus TaxID=361277 RepID=UPI003809C2B7